MKRGVDVVEVTARSKEDLVGMFPSPEPRHWWKRRYRATNNINDRRHDASRKADATVADLVQALQIASPFARQQLYATLKGMGCLDSLWPVPDVDPAR